MDIKILGPGCAKCHKLDKLVREVVDEMGISAKIEYIQDMGKIMDYPILTTPGLVINEEVVCAGKVPARQEIAEMLSKAQAG
ncbi:MAG: thioredoxin family protein [Dehalococcoidales bacterium]|jgi:small redox-active disulfide protein 2|nr:thioredoxin family protein [Dehalococcoidales bacterium]MDD3264366.1 thioredoxin family protein [Dehalococcoidales bacterium]MDD4322132.1 thioredoxin family protein [Dehalococcoidales bacterium]MDD4793702.1 thioredoxin family protein [Dehalococcoidales bacterium]MDD5497965.1 thioredoxin family protein [Dehalococcoidales bacterium]